MPPNIALNWCDIHECNYSTIIRNRFGVFNIHYLWMLSAFFKLQERGFFLVLFNHISTEGPLSLKHTSLIYWSC